MHLAALTSMYGAYVHGYIYIFSSSLCIYIFVKKMKNVLVWEEKTCNFVPILNVKILMYII